MIEKGCQSIVEIRNTPDFALVRKPAGTNKRLNRASGNESGDYVVWVIICEIINGITPPYLTYFTVVASKIHGQNTQLANSFIVHVPCQENLQAALLLFCIPCQSCGIAFAKNWKLHHYRYFTLPIRNCLWHELRRNWECHHTDLWTHTVKARESDSNRFEIYDYANECMLR